MVRAEDTENPNLAIETNEQTDLDLAYLAAYQAFNKTTAVNRAVQWYAECVRHIEAGGDIIFRTVEKDERIHLG